LERHPDRAKSFATAMSTVSRAALTPLSEYFDREGIDPNGLFVDVGGSQGHVSAHLAEAFPKLRFIVQDLPQVIGTRKDELSSLIRDRIEFMPYDMFTEQPVKGADVYLFRYVLHNWPDEYCIKICGSSCPR
jgi:hypothetical protein